ESWIGVQNAPEGFGEERSSGQHDQRQTDFCDGESAAQNRRPLPRSHAPHSLLEGFIEIVAPRTKRWNHSEDESSKQSQPKRKTQYAEIQPNVGSTRKIGGTKGENRLHSPACETYPGQRATYREQHALSNELAYYACL